MTPSVYNPDRLLEVFGTTAPDMSERSDYFGDLWKQWQDSGVELDMGKVIDRIRDGQYNSIVHVMSEAGYEQGFDYQKRGDWVRFVNSEVKAVFVLYYGDLIKH